MFLLLRIGVVVALLAYLSFERAEVAAGPAKSPNASGSSAAGLRAADSRPEALQAIASLSDLSRVWSSLPPPIRDEAVTGLSGALRRGIESAAAADAHLAAGRR